MLIGVQIDEAYESCLPYANSKMTICEHYFPTAWIYYQDWWMNNA